MANERTKKVGTRLQGGTGLGLFHVQRVFYRCHILLTDDNEIEERSYEPFSVLIKL